MLSSIHPLGERARQQSFWVTVTAYLIGTLVGGVATGALGGALGSLLPEGGWRLAAAAGIALVGGSLDFTGRKPPSVHRQVDENWLGRYRGWVYGLAFGLQLGAGVVTIVTSAAVYVTMALTVLVGSIGWGAVIGAVFALARGLAILPSRRIEDHESLRVMMRRLQDGLGRAQWLAIAAQVAVVITSLTLLMGG
jgi:hypothetical protein